MPKRYLSYIFVLAVIAAFAFGVKGVGGGGDDLNAACRDVCLTQGYQEGRANLVGGDPKDKDSGRFSGCACKDAAGKQTIVDERAPASAPTGPPAK